MLEWSFGREQDAHGPLPLGDGAGSVSGRDRPRRPRARPGARARLQEREAVAGGRSGARGHQLQIALYMIAVRELLSASRPAASTSRCAGGAARARARARRRDAGDSRHRPPLATRSWRRSSTPRGALPRAAPPSCAPGSSAPCRSVLGGGCGYPGICRARRDAGAPRPFTPEQRAAIADPGGLLLTANAGSGKTSVMAERYAVAARAEGAASARILAITFTEKAAAELKGRVRPLRAARRRRARARDRGRLDLDDPRFCARLLRTHALAAGLDPRFAVLDERAARRLAAAAFDAALETWSTRTAGRPLELVAAYGRRPARTRSSPPRRAAQPRQEAPRLRSRRRCAARRRALARPRAAAAELEAASDAACTLARAACLRASGWRAPAARAVPAALAAARPAARRRSRATAAPPTAPRWAATPTPAPTCRAARARAARRAAARASAPLRGRQDTAPALDFEDLELRANRLLRERRGLRARYAERFPHVMVDEFQDTNPLQLELLERIAGERAVRGRRRAAVDLRLPPCRRAAFPRPARGARRGRRARPREQLPQPSRPARRVNFAFAPRFDASSSRSSAARADGAGAVRARPAGGPRVELLVADARREGARPSSCRRLAAPLWRIAEARASRRACAGCSTRGGRRRRRPAAARDRPRALYERALVEQGVPRT